jgi:hypothetical protein
MVSASLWTIISLCAEKSEVPAMAWRRLRLALTEKGPASGHMLNVGKTGSGWRAVKVTRLTHLGYQPRIAEEQHFVPRTSWAIVGCCWVRNLYMTIRATVFVEIGKATAETARGFTNTCVTTPPINLDRIVPSGLRHFVQSTSPAHWDNGPEGIVREQHLSLVGEDQINPQAGRANVEPVRV